MTKTDPSGKALPRTPGVPVLIVDDSVAVRQRLAESLAPIAGVTVVGEAGDVRTGLQLLDELRPAVVVLDIDLPSQSGMDLLVLAKLRPEPPVVMMLSIHQEAPFRARCAQLGADHYFHKLTDFDRVADVCRQMASERLNEAQRIRAQRMECIGTMACGIAHDLNNILSPIMTSCELLDGPLADSDRQEMLGILRQSARRGADLVKHLLSFCRDVKGDRAELQVGPLLGEMRTIMSKTFPKSIELGLRTAPGLWAVSGDATQLYQVVLNLCINARDAMPEGGVLTLGAENVWDTGLAAPSAPPLPCVRISVSDTGTGIPEAIRERIFEPFFTTKEDGKGTGLGLSTSLGIIRNHGGRMAVSSEPGKGSVFTICLPALPQSTDSVPAPVDSPVPAGAGELLLVVDDEPAIRDILQRMLVASGYRVVTAASGAEAIAVQDRLGLQIGAILMDMIMPVMDGPSTLRAMSKRHRGLRVIAASGLSPEMHLPECPPGAVRAFLPKPYSSEKLLRTLNTILRHEPNLTDN